MAAHPASTLANNPRFDDPRYIEPVIRQKGGDFRLADIERACPDVGREWLRTLLADLKAAGEVSCQGRGSAARWRHLGSKGIKP